MASPTPEAAAAPAPSVDVEPKPVDAAPSKDLKADLNGSTPSESKLETPAPTEEPIVNGDDNSEDHGANGVSKEEAPKENGDKTDATEQSAPKSEGKPASPPAVKESEPVAPVSPPAEEPKAESPRDVEMSEAQPAEESSAPPAEAEKKPEPADSIMTETASAQPNPTPSDVAQEDVKQIVAAPGPSSEEKKDDTPQPTAEPPTSTDDAALPTSEVDLGPTSLSQLNIETAEGDTSPVEPTVQPSVEVSMTDAPAVKVAREREDDAVEEPAPKRARTEPKESEEKDEPAHETAPSTPATSAPLPPAADLPQPNDTTLTHFENFRQWNDPEFNNRQIQPFQRRDLRKSMARVKKTKHGANFRDAVTNLWPGIKDTYLVKVQYPMDLGYIDKALRDGKYNTFGEVKIALAIMYENCIKYNGAEHEMARSAHNAVSSAWDDIMAIPANEPVKAKPPPKIRGPREPRALPVKSEVAEEGHAGSPGAEVAPKAAAPPRRQSMLAEADRPKRTPRPTKPKDIEYGNTGKHLKPELQFADEILTELTTKKNAAEAFWFKAPVDVEGLGIPLYRTMIKEPMDFGTIGDRLHDGKIPTLKEFEKAMRLVFSNAFTFNGRPVGDPVQNPVPYAAQSLEEQFKTLIKNKDKWMAKRNKARAPPPSASAGSDDDDDEDDEDEGEAGPDPSTQVREREVKDLDARYREETQKLTDLFAAEAPNQSMIDVQQAVLNMVQKALLDAKLKLNEAKQKSGGGKSKKAKPAKKATGGGGRKSGGAAPAPKKATGGGGQKKKKNLSAADKDNIANAINDLEYPHLDKAIDIIKRDTGQMESDDGELELDIDQLSHEALLKLWELCKRVLNGFGKDNAAAAPAAPPSPEMHKSGKKNQAAAPKNKKNKPMSAQEQEARIAQLTELRAAYKKGEEPNEEAHGDFSMQHDGDSTDDSSEEE